MKVNEAPEKIILSADRETGTLIRHGNVLKEKLKGIITKIYLLLILGITFMKNLKN